MEEINAKAKGPEYIDKKNKGKKKELWIFFDEINTCLSLSLLTEIFIKFISLLNIFLLFMRQEPKRFDNHISN